MVPKHYIYKVIIITTLSSITKQVIIKANYRDLISRWKQCYRKDESKLAYLQLHCVYTDTGQYLFFHEIW